MKLRRGKFRNRQTKHVVDPGYTLNTTREVIEYYGTPVYYGWKNVPENLISATQARALKAQVSADPVAYCEDEWHWLTALYEVKP